MHDMLSVKTADFLKLCFKFHLDHDGVELESLVVLPKRAYSI